MSLYFVSLYKTLDTPCDFHAIILNGSIVGTYDQSINDTCCLNLLEEVAVNLSRSLGLPVQRERMLEFIGWTWDAVIERLSPFFQDQQPKRLTIAVHTSGGLIQEFFCEDTQGHHLSFSVFDYDVEGVEPDDITQVVQEDGTVADAYVTHFGSSDAPKFDFNAVVNA